MMIKHFAIAMPIKNGVITAVLLSFVMGFANAQQSSNEPLTNSQPTDATPQNVPSNAVYDAMYNAIYPPQVSASTPANETTPPPSTPQPHQDGPTNNGGTAQSETVTLENPSSPHTEDRDLLNQHLGQSVNGIADPQVGGGIGDCLSCTRGDPRPPRQ